MIYIGLVGGGHCFPSLIPVRPWPPEGTGRPSASQILGTEERSTSLGCECGSLAERGKVRIMRLVSGGKIGG